MHPLYDLTPGPNPPQEIHALIEIPKGSRNKYELDKKSGYFKLDRTLYSSMVYPGDYGLMPRTHADDGDPLDVLILCTEPTFTGCVVEARPIGVFRMLDKGSFDDKILCVPVKNPFFRMFHDLADTPPHFLDEVSHFFNVYKDLEGGRTQPIGWEPVEVAHKLILEAMDAFRRMHGSQASHAPSVPNHGFEVVV